MTDARNSVGTVAVFCLSVASFLLVIGGAALDPMNIEWLPGSDPKTHFLGWDFFRYSPWSFPIGANPRYGLEISSSILYSDSIPLLAFLFKPFSALLPEPFQYLGIWLLLCFVLQGWFAWKLIGLSVTSVSVRFFGAGLFVIAPSFLMRLDCHIALAGHWLVLAGLYLVVNPAKERLRHPALWVALCAVTALVHTYLLLMVLALWFADVLNRFSLLGQRSLRPVGEAVLMGSVALFCLWQAGLFTVGADSFSSGGYGYYRMNLLAPIDAGGWSMVLPDMPQGRGDYEGFNYLGLGALIALAAALVTTLRQPKLLLPPRQTLMLPVVLLLLFAFAVTNKLAVGGHELTFPLPPPLLDVANMFRASGRLFWPVLYAALFGIISVLVRGYGQAATAFILAICFVIQIADTYPGWAARRDHTSWNWEAWEPLLYAEFWDAVPTRYDKVRLVMPQNHHCHWGTFAYFAARNGMSTDAIYTARVDEERLKRAQDRALSTIVSGNYDRDSVYILEERYLTLAALNLRSDDDVLAKIDDFYVVAPGWRRCATCAQIPGEIQLSDVLPQLHLGESLSFNTQGPGESYLARGWSIIEPWGVWSDGPVAIMVLPIPEYHSADLQLWLDAQALIAPAQPTQSVRILVNGVYAGTMAFSMADNRRRRSIRVPAEALAGGGQQHLLVQLEIDSPARPADLGMNNEDKRELGIGLFNLTLSASH